MGDALELTETFLPFSSSQEPKLTSENNSRNTKDWSQFGWEWTGAWFIIS